MSATSNCLVETVHSSSETDRCRNIGSDDGSPNDFKEVDPFDKSSSWYSPSTTSSSRDTTPSYSHRSPQEFVDLYSSLASRQKVQQQSSVSMHNQQQQYQQKAIVPVPQTQTTIIPYQQPPPPSPPRLHHPHLIATISAGFEKGDYLIRETHGSNVYFDFFEEAYNFACQKGFSRMPPDEEAEYIELVRRAHKSVPGGCRYNTGRLLMVLRKRLVPLVQLSTGDEQYEEEDEPCGLVMEDVGNHSSSNSTSYLSKNNGKKKKTTNKQKQNKSTNNNAASYITTTNSKNKQQLRKKLLGQSTNTLPTDSETSNSSRSAPSSSAYSSSSAADTSYVDSWE